MSADLQTAPGITVTRIPDPAEPVPAVAWPTVALLVVGLALWFGSVAALLSGLWPWPVSTLISAVASYVLFTVAHDAAHHSTSSNQQINRWIGRLAVPFFAPHAGMSTWRYIHMQHHRFTNHDDGNDPDHYTMRGPAWQRPLRWITVDLFYMVFYVPRLASRPRAEKIELFTQWAVVITLSVLAVVNGYGFELLVLYFLPCRIAILFLGWAFDYLPHNGLHHTPTEDKLKTTRNRVGGERWLSPVLLYQNYHLVHHLHPLVPFYRYIKVWRRNERTYLNGDPALSTVGGRELTIEEYAQLRELAAH
ncbi:MAG: fatty acid desaturase [Thermoleophilaceae bacterium]|nr:fatty acid desaturase [Thermoleophilaceae bacterium]